MIPMSSNPNRAYRFDSKQRYIIENTDSAYLRLETKARRSMAIGNFEKAYGIAKEMLRSHDSRKPGYEIGAAALRALGDHGKARRLDQEWQMKLIPRDPMCLPTEVLLMIFEQLAAQEVLRATRVSKTWKEVLTSKPFGNIYAHLDLHGGSSINALTRHIRTCDTLSNGGIKTAILNIPKVSNGIPAFEALIGNGQNLEALVFVRVNVGRSVTDPRLHRISLLPRLTTLNLSSFFLIGSQELLTILKSGPNLVNVDIRGIRGRLPAGKCFRYSSSKLQRLRLRSDRGSGDIVLGSNELRDLDPHAHGYLSLELPEIRELYLEGGFEYNESATKSSLQSFPKLECLSLVNICIKSSKLSPPASLRKLHLEKNCFALDTKFSVPFEALEEITILENELRSTGPFDLHKWFAKGEGQGTLLKKLHIAFGEPMHDREAKEFFSRQDLIGLTELNTTCPAFDDHCAEAMAGMDQLKKVTLRCARDITGVGVRKWVDGVLPKLRVLKFVGCERISLDAIEYCWAARLKVTVSSMFPDYDGGRPLR